MRGTLKPNLWREFREGFSAMHAVPGMGWFFTLAILVWFFIMPLGVMFPLMTLQHFGGNTYDMSLIEIVWGGGALIGGAIMGAGLIIYVTAFGFADIRRFFTYKTYQRVVLCALLTYAASKCYSFYTGANGIHSIIPLGTPGAILSSGLILVLNICVGFIVTCTMYAFYAVFRKGEV